MKRSALMGPARTGIAAIALAMTLAACDQLRQITGMDGDNTSTANTSATANTSGSGPSLSGTTGDKPAEGGGASANPELASQMTVAAQQLQSQLPIRADAITSVTGIRAEGTEFVYDMRISQALPVGVDQARQLMQAQNQTNMCRDPNTSRLINMGGSMRHIYTDTAGATFETRVTSCP